MKETCTEQIMKDIARDGNQLKYMSEEVQNDKNVVVLAVSQNGDSLY